MKSTIKKLSPDLLTIDPNVQRVEGMDQVRANKIADEFKPHLLGTFVVSERPNGQLVVLDGMHRLGACRASGHTAPVTCEVFTGLDLADEAGLFLGRNNGRMPSALSKFHARVLMGDPIACDIEAILSAHQWTVSPASEPGNLAAIDAMERVYRNGGGTVPDGKHPDLADRVISIITAAWEWDVKSTNAGMLLAVAQLIGRFGPSVDTKKLIDEMQATRPGVLIGRAKTLQSAQGGTVPAALAKILAGMHNRKRRSNLLPEWVWIR